MGRGLILFIVGMFIIMGIFNFASQNRLISSDEDMARQVSHLIASSAALSGLEIAGQAFIVPGYLEEAEKFDAVGHSITRTLDEGHATVWLTSKTNTRVSFRSTGVFDGVESNILAEYRIENNGRMPKLEGAIGIYGDLRDFNVRGQAFEINGCDHPIPPADRSRNEKIHGGIDSCDGEDDASGIAVSTYGDNLNLSIINSALGLPQQGQGSIKADNVIGQGGDRNILESDDNGDFINAFIRELLDNASPGQVSSELLGTKENPRITHVKSGTLELTGTNQDAAGIIIIDKGAELVVSGTFDYHGLIISAGDVTVASGDFFLYGGVLFGGDPEINVFESADFLGNIHIRYSSEVIRWLDQSFTEGFIQRLVLLSTFTDSQ